MVALEERALWSEYLHPWKAKPREGCKDFYSRSLNFGPLAKQVMASLFFYLPSHIFIVTLIFP